MESNFVWRVAIEQLSK